MSNQFYLIQRGKFNDDRLKTASAIVGYNGLIELDYMGAAEFEWGAIPKAIRRIMGQYDKYSLHVTDLTTRTGMPFCLYCRDDRYEIILATIKDDINKPYQTKEWSNLSEHFQERVSKNDKYALRTNFWWCIDKADPNPDENDKYANLVGDWIAFNGPGIRQKAFTRIMSLSYNNWWMEFSEQERKFEFDNAF